MSAGNKRFNALPATHAPGSLHLTAPETMTPAEIEAANLVNESIGKLQSVAASIAIDGKGKPESPKAVYAYSKTPGSLSPSCTPSKSQLKERRAKPGRPKGSQNASSKKGMQYSSQFATPNTSITTTPRKNQSKKADGAGDEDVEDDKDKKDKKLVFLSRSVLQKVRERPMVTGTQIANEILEMYKQFCDIGQKVDFKNV